MSDQEEGLQIETLMGGGFNPDRIRTLVYGESGVGKTRFFSTWPKPLFIDLDDGMASVTTQVDRIGVTDWADIEAIYQFLLEGEHGYKTIVIDSVNELQLLALRATVQNFPNVKRSYNSLAGQSDYGKMLADVDETIRWFKGLPIHLGLIAQVAPKEFDTDIVVPQLLGKQSARNYCRMMDVVGYMYREEDKPTLAFNLAEFTSKDRSGALPPTITNPTYKRLARYWSTRKGATE